MAQAHPSFLDIDDCDLTEEGPRNIQPHHIVTDVRPTSARKRTCLISEYAQMTYLLLQIKLAGVTGRVFDSCFSIQVPTYRSYSSVALLVPI